MAKLYGEINASALMTFDKSFARSNGQPLDSTEVFYSKAAAETYAAGEVAYVGQKIVVVETVDDVIKVTHYGIEADNSLKELGSSPVGDESTITVAEDGTVSLYGIAGLTFTEKNAEGEDVSVTYQPLLTSAGLTWVKPSATTVEGLATEIEGLKTRMTSVEGKAHEHENEDVLKGITADKVSAWDTAATDVTKKVASVTAGDNSVTVGGTATEPTIAAKLSQDSDNALELAEDGLKVVIPAAAEYSIVKAETSNDYAAVYNLTKDGEIVGASINIPKDMVVESGSVVENPDGQDAGTYIELKLQNVVDPLYINVGSLIEYVTSGSKDDDMVVISVSDDHKVTASITNDSIVFGKLSTDVRDRIAEAHHNNRAVLDIITEDKVNAWDAAQVNVIDSVDTAQFGLDENKNLTLLDIAMGKVTGLSDALAGKVDVVEGSRLITSDEADKLEKLVLGENGEVSVSGKIAAGNVDGLEDWITTRAGTLEGLSENNFNDTLLDKLNGIAEGAQVNAIDGASEEFTISADGKILSVKAIDKSKITGLADALAGKVDVVEGKGLSSNDFTDTLLDKLNGIAEGAEVNYVKSVTSEFAVSDAGELSVVSVNVNKLVQTEGEVLILNGGAAV